LTITIRRYHWRDRRSRDEMHSRYIETKLERQEPKFRLNPQSLFLLWAAELPGDYIEDV